MKDLKKMTKKERKEIFISTSAEVQDLCEFEPAIKTDGKSEKEIVAILTEAYVELTPEDKLSKEAVSTFEFLGLRKFTTVEEEEETIEDGIEDATEVPDEEEEEETPKKKSKKEPKEEEEKPKENKVEKKEGQVSMAIFIDGVVEGKGSFEELAVLVTKEYADRGKSTKCTVGTLKSHIKYRCNQDSKWLKSRKLKMTDDGIE